MLLPSCVNLQVLVGKNQRVILMISYLSNVLPYIHFDDKNIHEILKIIKYERLHLANVEKAVNK